MSNASGSAGGGVSNENFSSIIVGRSALLFMKSEQINENDSIYDQGSQQVAGSPIEDDGYYNIKEEINLPPINEEDNNEDEEDNNEVEEGNNEDEQEQLESFGQAAAESGYENANEIDRLWFQFKKDHEGFLFPQKNPYPRESSRLKQLKEDRKLKEDKQKSIELAAVTDSGRRLASEVAGDGGRESAAAAGGGGAGLPPPVQFASLSQGVQLDISPTQIKVKCSRQDSNLTQQCKLLHPEDKNICFNCKGPFFKTEKRVFGRSWMNMTYIVIASRSGTCRMQSNQGMGNNSGEHYPTCGIMNAISGEVPMGINIEKQPIYHLFQASLDWMHYCENGAKNALQTIIYDGHVLRPSLRNLVILGNKTWNGNITGVRYYGQENSCVYLIEDNKTITGFHHPAEFTCAVLARIVNPENKSIVHPSGGRIYDLWKLHQLLSNWLRGKYICDWALQAAGGNHKKLLEILGERLTNRKSPENDWKDAHTDKTKKPSATNWMKILNEVGTSISPFNDIELWPIVQIQGAFFSALYTLINDLDNKGINILSIQASENPLYWLTRLISNIDKASPTKENYMDRCIYIFKNFFNVLPFNRINDWLIGNQEANIDALKEYEKVGNKNKEKAQHILEAADAAADSVVIEEEENINTARYLAAKSVIEKAKREMIGGDAGGRRGAGAERQRKTRFRKRQTQKRKTRKNRKQRK